MPEGGIIVMMPRNEAWERRAAVDLAQQLIELLRKGQQLDVDVDGYGTLRSWLVSLRGELDVATPD